MPTRVTPWAAAGISPGSTVAADGLSFKWPDVQPCNVDNILIEGQTMLLTGKRQHAGLPWFIDQWHLRGNRGHPLHGRHNVDCDADIE